MDSAWTSLPFIMSCIVYQVLLHFTFGIQILYSHLISAILPCDHSHFCSTYYVFLCPHFVVIVIRLSLTRKLYISRLYRIILSIIWLMYSFFVRFLFLCSTIYIRPFNALIAYKYKSKSIKRKNQNGGYKYMHDILHSMQIL